MSESLARFVFRCLLAAFISTILFISKKLSNKKSEPTSTSENKSRETNHNPLTTNVTFFSIVFGIIFVIFQTAAITDVYNKGREIIEDPAIDLMIDLGVVKTSASPAPTVPSGPTSTPEKSTLTIDTLESPDIESPDISPKPPSRKFEDYVSYYLDGKIKYSSPEYDIDVILPNGYICENYYSEPQGLQEEIQLQYELDMKLEIIIANTGYMGFDSLEKYYEHYHSLYNETKDKSNDSLFDSLRLDSNIPFCLFTFLYDRNGAERWVYYELICNLDDVWYATKFNYPANNKEICDNIVGDYVNDIFA